MTIKQSQYLENFLVRNHRNFIVWLRIRNGIWCQISDIREGYAYLRSVPDNMADEIPHKFSIEEIYIQNIKVTSENLVFWE